MFIGWLRKASLKEDLKKLSESVLIDENLILNSFEEDQNLCFGAYEGEDLKAVITAYSFKDSILINNLCYTEDTDTEVIKRVLKVLMNNIADTSQTILFMANIKESKIFAKLGFKKYARFKKAVHSGEAVAFNFSNATAKSITRPNYLGTIKKLDFDALNEDRYDYITEICSKVSSLTLSTEFGYQHSYAINKNHIKISPWIMVDEAFTDAEKLIRGVLYHRGLKTLISIIPADIKEITDLYKSYKFELKSDLYLVYLNKKPNINLASVYGF
jgi:hypothetical protein